MVTYCILAILFLIVTLGGAMAFEFFSYEEEQKMKF